jgi:hypothetical protein
MWYDEVLTWLLINDPSWRHMVAVIRQGGDAAPPLYHFLARGWAAMFGATPLSLRLFTTAGLSTALLVVWRTLAGAFHWRAAALGTLVVFCATDPFFWQIAEVRYYGVLTTLVAVSVLLCHRLMLCETPTRGLVAANVGVQAGLVLCHIYGGMYGAAQLLALVVWDVLRGAVRPSRWLSYPVGWLALSLWVSGYRSQRAAVPRSWMQAPSFSQLSEAYGFGLNMHIAGLVLTAAILLTAIPIAMRVTRIAALPNDSPTDAMPATVMRRRGALLVIAAGLLTVPLMSFVVSRLTFPIFYPRYFIAVSFAPAILVAHVLTVLTESPHGRWGESVVPPRIGRLLIAAGWTGVFGLLLIWPVRSSQADRGSIRPGAVIERLRVDGAPITAVPIVLERPFDELQVVAYSTLPRSAYTFVMDSALGMDPKADHNEMLGYALLKIYQRVGYPGAHIEDGQRFLCATDRFVVVDRPLGTWYDQRVARDPAFTTSDIGAERGAAIRLVRRVPGATPAGCAAAASAPPTGATSPSLQGGHVPQEVPR